MDIISYILSRKYTDNSLIGLGALKGAACQVKNIVHQDGINTVTFEWEGTDGTKKTRDMVVYDGTPIYVWESGNTYHYGDLAIYESQFYRCIVENSDVVFDNTKWNEIGSPDGNYDIVQSKALLPARFTAADRKLYFVIDECIFYLWDGTQWVGEYHLVQEETLPTASAKFLGRIYQYIGTTDANYTHGFVYECVSDGEPTPTYSWVELATMRVEQATQNTLGIVKGGKGTTINNQGGVDANVNIFIGTQEQWDNLTSAQQNEYDEVDITDDEQTINLGIYLRKVQTMPNADDCPSEIVIYVGANTEDYTNGFFYKSLPVIDDGTVTYHWVRLDTQPYVQANYTQEDSTAHDYIKNKPTLGTAAAKDFTTNVRPNNHDLVESNAVYAAINSALSSIYTPHGDLTCEELVADLLIPSNVGNIYTMTDSGTTNALFINGVGVPIHVNDSVGIIRAGADSIMFNYMGNVFDLHDYQTKELDTPLTIDGTQKTEVESALDGLNNGLKDRVTYAYNGEMGAKNLIPFNYSSKTSGNTTFIVNTNSSITVNGTVDVGEYIFLDLINKNSGFTLPEGTYTISDGDVTMGIVHLLVRLQTTDSSGYTDLAITANNNRSVTFNITQEQAQSMMDGTYALVVRLYCANYSQTAVTIDNVNVYPMLRHGVDTDPTWQPYAKTNYQLTQDVNIIKSDITNLQDIPIKNGVGTGSIIECNLINNTANGINSHAEGNGTSATGNYSHAEGSACGSRGNYSHAQNHSTVAQGMSQTTLGEYNIAQGSPTSKTDTDYAFIIGNGTDNDHRSNAFAVQWNGTVVFSDGSKQNIAALEKVSVLPTASVDYLNKVYLLTSTQTGYKKGGIYQCVSDGESTPTYSWLLISASDEDKVSYAYQGRVGAKNLLVYPYQMQGTSTNHEVDCIINKDGSITVDGTATNGNADFNIYNYQNSKHFTLKEGSYILTGSQSPAIMYLFLRTADGTTEVNQQMNGSILTISSQDAERIANEELFVCIRVRVPNESTANNLTLYPMIRYADNTDNTWQPYAATNEELTRTSGNRRIVYIEASDGINSFYNKMKSAFYNKNCDVYIGKGNYIYTNDLVDAIRATNKRGIPIGNGCRYYFDSGAHLYCEYTGSNVTDVKAYFSPLDAQNISSDFEIYNLDIVAKNVLYAVHDDANGGEFCRHIYRNCYIELDNTTLGSDSNSLSKALGGGLAKYEEVIIENCVFKATNPLDLNLEDASYHGANNSSFTSDAHIIVTGSSFAHQFRCSDKTENVEAPYPHIIYTGNTSANNVNIPSTWNSYVWNNKQPSEENVEFTAQELQAMW